MVDASDRLENRLLEEKKKKFLEFVKRAVREFNLEEAPTIRFWADYCPSDAGNELAHIHLNEKPPIICISKRRLKRMTMEQVENTATHEVTHMKTGPGHESVLYISIDSVIQNNWQPTTGIPIIDERAVDRVILKGKKRKKPTDECNYYFCKIKENLKPCKACNGYFCKQHLKPKPPSTPKFDSQTVSDFVSVEQWRKELGHPCTAYYDWQSQTDSRELVSIYKKLDKGRPGSHNYTKKARKLKQEKQDHKEEIEKTAEEPDIVDKCPNCGKKLPKLAPPCKFCFRTFCSNCQLPETHNCWEATMYRNFCIDLCKQGRGSILEEKEEVVLTMFRKWLLEDYGGGSKQKGKNSIIKDNEVAVRPEFSKWLEDYFGSSKLEKDARKIANSYEKQEEIEENTPVCSYANCCKNSISQCPYCGNSFCKFHLEVAYNGNFGHSCNAYIEHVKKIQQKPQKGIESIFEKIKKFFRG